MLVDQATGTVTIRARFPNPQSLLLPGMFVTRPIRAGHRHVGLPGAAARNHAAIRRGMRPCGSSGPAIAQSSASSSPSGRRAQYWVVTAGPRARREGDHARAPANLQRRRADQARAGQRAAARQGAAARRQASGGRLAQVRLAHVEDLHRSPDLRLGDRDHHHADGHRRDRLAAGRAISRRRADPDQHPRELSRAPLPRHSKAASRRCWSSSSPASTGCSISSLRRPRADRSRSASFFKRASTPTSRRSRSRTRSRRRSRGFRSRCSSRASGSARVRRTCC